MWIFRFRLDLCRTNQIVVFCEEMMLVIKLFVPKRMLFNFAKILLILITYTAK